MPKLSRRALLLSGAATVAAGVAAGSCVWPYRAYLFEKFGPPRFKVPSARLPACTPGSLASDARDSMRNYFDGLAAAIEMPALTSGEFARVVDLKCQMAPSYLAAYEQFSAALPPASYSPETFLAELVVRAVEGNVADAQSLRFVVREFLALQYARGGFRSVGLSNAAGHPGGPNGYRLSRRSRDEAASRSRPASGSGSGSGSGSSAS